jgi:hypothetical protein
VALFFSLKTAARQFRGLLWFNKKLHHLFYQLPQCHQSIINIFTPGLTETDADAVGIIAA